MYREDCRSGGKIGKFLFEYNYLLMKGDVWPSAKGEVRGWDVGDLGEEKV